MEKEAWRRATVCFFAEKENARRIPVKPLTLEPRVTIVKDISLSGVFMNTPSSALSDEMKGAMSTLLNAVIFEQWLRFSWIEEDEEGDFCIQIPAETVSELVEDYPEYEGLIAQLNGTIVDADMACSAVLGYARSSLGEQSLAVLEHNEFQNMVGRFHQWLNDNVEALDQDPKNFDQWCELFLADLQQAKDGNA